MASDRLGDDTRHGEEYGDEVYHEPEKTWSGTFVKYSAGLLTIRRSVLLGLAFVTLVCAEMLVGTPFNLSQFDMVYMAFTAGALFGLLPAMVDE